MPRPFIVVALLAPATFAAAQNVAVCDFASGRVRLLDSNGAMFSQSPVLPASPVSVAETPDGLLWVGLNNGSIVRLNPITWQQVGGSIPISSPSSMAVGPQGDVYVGSFAAETVSRFNGATGQFVQTVATLSGPLAGGGILGLAFRPDGDLFVSLRNLGTIERFAGGTWSHLGTFATPGSFGGFGPQDVEFGSDGHMYVISENHAAIVRFDGQTGQQLFAFTPNFGFGDGATLVFDELTNSVLLSAGFAHNIERYSLDTGASLGIHAAFPGFAPLGMTRISIPAPPALAIFAPLLLFAHWRRR